MKVTVAGKDCETIADINFHNGVIGAIKDRISTDDSIIPYSNK